MPKAWSAKAQFGWLDSAGWLEPVGDYLRLGDFPVKDEGDHFRDSDSTKDAAGFPEGWDVSIAEYVVYVSCCLH